MNELINIQNEITMTSLEIAELTGKDHRNVVRDIEGQLGQLKEISLLKFEQSYTNARGRTYKMYRLPKREVLILISGYSVQLRAKIIDKLEELERQLKNQTPQLPQTYLEALESLVESEKRNQALQNKIEQDKPKVAFADSVASSDDTISIGQLAKLLKQNGIETGRKRLFDYFRKNGYLIKGKSKDYNTPSQKAMEQGLFKIKEAVINMGDKAILSLSPRVTSKGQAYFINLFMNGVDTGTGSPV